MALKKQYQFLNGLTGDYLRYSKHVYDKRSGLFIFTFDFWKDQDFAQGEGIRSPILQIHLLLSNDDVKLPDLNFDINALDPNIETAAYGCFKGTLNDQNFGTTGKCWQLPAGITETFLSGIWEDV